MSSHPRTPLVSPPSASTALRPTFPALQPYLGATAHLSLSWLSQTFLSLILLIASLGLLVSTVTTLVNEAKATLASACGGVEAAAGVAVNLPRYMAEGVNEMNVAAVKAVTTGLADSLDLLLLAVQEIVVFMIEMYIGMYVCLLDMAVSGALDIVIATVEEAESFITDAFADVGTALNASVAKINSALSTAEGVVDKLGFDLDYQIDATSFMADLENVTFSPTFLNELKNLSASIPTYSDLKADLELLISTPVSLLRSTISSSLGNATLSVDTLPVPTTTSLTFCSSLDTSFLDDVGHTLSSFLKLALGLVILALVLLAAGSLLWERYRYRRYVEGVERAREAWQLDLAPGAELLSTASLLAFLGAAESPTVAYYLARLANRLKLSPAQRSNMHWFGAYILHPWALLFLLIGVVGLIVVQIQIAALEGPVRDAAQAQAASGAADFSASVVSAINGNMNATSSKYANETNVVLATFSNGVNDDLFGWVNTTTTALNTTLVTFYDELTGAITDLFNGTVLETPALNLAYCLLGSKIDSLESALTYLNENLHLSLPTVPDSVLMLSSNATTELTSSITSTNSSVSATSLVDKMVAEYARTLSSQRLGFALCIALWGVVLLMGLVGLWWRIREEKRWEAGRGRRKLKGLSLSGGGGGGAGKGGKDEGYEMGEKGGRAFRSSYQPMPGSDARHAGVWPAAIMTGAGSLVSTVKSMLSSKSGARRRQVPTALEDPSHSAPAAAPSSFSALRARVPRPTPAFRAARDALTRVLPANRQDKQASADETSQHVALQTWDPPTSPAPVSNTSRMRTFLAAATATATATAASAPTRPTSFGWQPLASPSAFALGDDDSAWPPSPPYRRNSHQDPFADAAGMSSRASLLPSYPVLEFGGLAGGSGRHPFAQAEDSEKDPFAEGGGGTAEGPAGVGRKPTGYRVGGSRRPVPRLEESGEETDPFATPFDGQNELS